MPENSFPTSCLPRLIVAGLSGGTGKTMVSIGLVHALTQKGLRISPFKKGPDYIDTAWLELAANHRTKYNTTQNIILENAHLPYIYGRNLDPFMVQTELLPELLLYPFQTDPSLDMAIIEGNRGLFDGHDLAGSCSTAELSRTISAPLILVVDCTKMTRTTAAIVFGCKNFEPDLNLAGVILNRATRDRHRQIVKEAVETLAGVPVLGILPRLDEAPVKERHTGLVLENRRAGKISASAEKSLHTLARLIQDNVDLDRVIAIAQSAPTMTSTRPETLYTPANIAEPASNLLCEVLAKPRIGYIRDHAFCHGYIENVEALQRAGAEVVNISLLDSDCTAGNQHRLDGLYFSGGLAVEYLEQLAADKQQQNNILRLAQMGLPIYAESGGLLYLARKIKIREKMHSMCGLFDFCADIQPKPQGIGYVEANVVLDTPWYSKGSTIHAHEFHYTCSILGDSDRPGIVFKLAKGFGLGAVYNNEDKQKNPGNQDYANMDGFFVYNTLAAFMHIFSPGCPEWAANFVATTNKTAFSRQDIM